MRIAPRLMIASLAVLVALSAAAADVTGDWTATVATATQSSEYTFTFRQVESRIVGTIRSQHGVVAISNGYINFRTVTFDENVTVQGRRAVFEYTGELVSETQMRFKRQVLGARSGVVEFVATRSSAP
jgi:negative regulator of sigma E activity